MSSKGAADLTVGFEGDESQETLLYKGDTVVDPCNCQEIIRDNVYETTANHSPPISKAWRNAHSEQGSDFQLCYHPFKYYERSESGTSSPFAVVSDTDSMVKKGITITISTRFQHLTVMDCYSNKSFEELRLEDYVNSNLAHGKEVPDSFKASPLPSSSSSSSFPIALQSLEMQPRSSPIQSSGFTSNILPGSSDSFSSFQRVLKRAQRRRANMRPDKTFPKRSSADASFVLSATTSQFIFTPNMNLVSQTNPQASLPNTSFSFTPNISFTSELDLPCTVTAAQSQAVEKKQPLTPSVAERQQFRDALLNNIFKCTQIQNSLYRLSLLKLQAHLTGPIDTSFEKDGASDLPKTSRSAKAKESVLNGVQQANTVSHHSSRADSPKVMSHDSTRACLKTTSSEYDTLNSMGGFDDTSTISGVESTKERINDIPEFFNVDEAGMSSSKASSINESVKNITDASHAPIVETQSSVDGVFDDAAITSTVDRNEVNVFDVPTCSNTKNARKSLYDAPVALIRELKDLLNALSRFAVIHVWLFQRLMTVSKLTTEEPAEESSLHENKGLFTDGKVDIRTVQSKLEAINFKTKMECKYVRDPFSNQHLKPSTSEDVVQHIPPVRHLSSQLAGWNTCSLRELPHGHGILKTTTGEFIYCGDWCRGKRHGKGEGLILSVPSFNHSAAEQGFYIGGWKHNMRHGYGQMIFSSDAVYEGQWHFDKMTGFGALRLPDGSIQEGTWRDGSLQGCALFTWPHGVTEYREYDANRGQLSSCKLDKEVAEKLTQMSNIRSQLLNLRDCATELKDEKISLVERINTLKSEYTGLVARLQTFAVEICKKYEQQWERDSRKQRDEFEKVLKDAESKVAGENEKLKMELEETKAALLCQICFERRRDCIILPCSHLLYCRQCVTKHKNNGESRCPTCRGPINSEILCNINHSP